MSVSDEYRRAQVITDRERLLDAAVRYVRDGKDGTAQDRLRVASDLSGLSTLTIELELKR